MKSRVTGHLYNADVVNLAVVGDAPDDYPGLPGWGARSSAAVLAKFLHLESIPQKLERMAGERHQGARSPTAVSRVANAILFRRLAAPD